MPSTRPTLEKNPIALPANSRPRAHQRLDTLRAWLIAHNRLIMAIVCAVLGLLLIGKGLAALL